MDVMVKAKATAQAPMPLSEIAAKAGMLVESVQDLLDLMYETTPKSVNRAEITRKGIKQWFYWPTGMVEQAKRMHIVINPRKATFGGAPLNPPRRLETKPQAAPAKPIEATVQKTAQINQETVMETTETNQAEPKKKVLIMLEHMEQCPNCTGASLRKVADVKTIDGYIPRYLANGDVIKTQNGPHESRYCLREGMTAKEVYATPKTARGVNKIKPEVSSQPVTAPDLVIPAFLRKENQPKVDHQVITETVTAALAELNSADFTPAKDFVLEEKPQSKVRFAITSDRTLLIFNLQDKPIELNADATAALDEFLGDIFLIEHENRVGSMTL